MMIKKICDKCGTPVVNYDPSTNMILPTYTPTYAITKYFDSGFPSFICSIDLCPKCERLLDKWLKEKPEPEENEDD